MKRVNNTYVLVTKISLSWEDLHLSFSHDTVVTEAKSLYLWQSMA